MITLLIIALLLGSISYFIYSQPDRFTVTRKTTIAAKPEKAFAVVNDLHAWNSWSPWARIDPHATITFEGPSQGLGALMRWSSKSPKVGVGSMTITESHPFEIIRLKLEFLKPMPGTNEGEFIFSASGNQTTISWSTSGHKNFLAKAMGLLMDCDKMIGDQFEKGLNQMKELLEHNEL